MITGVLIGIESTLAVEIVGLAGWLVWAVKHGRGTVTVVKKDGREKTYGEIKP